MLPLDTDHAGTVRVIWSRLHRLVSEPQWILLGAALLSLALLLGFLTLAEALVDGELGATDRWLLRLARQRLVGAPDSPVADVALNLTALGGVPVLVLLMVLVTGFLLLNRTPWHALYAAAVASGGGLLSELLKGIYLRARPSEVAPLVHSQGFSFPSGHALASAVIYLTLGALLASTVQRRRMKLYLLSVALLLTFLVGCSRVLLGVHYPSDVLAGWMLGLSWALVCWLVFELVVRRRAAGPGG